MFYEVLSSNISINEMKQKLETAGFKIDYIERKSDRIFGAVFLDNVRLIDNV